MNQGQINLSIGERLKSARDAKGLSLEEACLFTKIQRKTLEAIEEDRLDEELDPAYAKIFLKKYAAFLEMDPASVVQEYIALRGPIPERPIAVQTEARKKSGSSGFLQKVLWLAGGLFLLYVGYHLYPGHFKRSPAASHMKRMEKKKGSAASSQKAPVASSKTEKTSEAPQLLVPRSQPLKLTVRTNADVWMQVKSDGSVIFQNVLARAMQESWTAENSLEIWTGNAGAMELFLNGRPLGKLGSGVKKGIRVTREGLKLPE